MTLVKPETLLAWNRKLKALKHTFPHVNEKPGRPAYDQETIVLVLKLAKENCWGYDRIKNEMQKLGHHVSDSYVKHVLRENGLPIQPIRKNLDWRKFLKAHMHQFWATDFFTEEVWTLRGLTTYYVLFFIHLETRQLFIAGATPNPKAAWTRRKTRQFLAYCEEHNLQCNYLIYDRDRSFCPVDTFLKKQTPPIDIIKTPPRTPQCNGYPERFVREARESLDNMILLGERHLLWALSEIQTFHNTYRPHQGLNGNIPAGYNYPKHPAKSEDIKCKEFLGGYLNHYYVEEDTPKGDLHKLAA